MRRRIMARGKNVLLVLMVLFVLNANGQINQTALIDKFVLGNDASEKAHNFASTESKAIIGGLGETARVLEPKPTPSWQGGSLSFTIKVDPEKQNYITTRFWGSDVSKDRLYFVCGGKQIGSRHLGDMDMLDVGSDFPFYNERFFYTTLPLPLSLTKGRTELTFEIRSQGFIWGYGTTWAAYQKDMTVETRGIYTVYTHTDGSFVPPVNEKQGTPPAYAKRPYPGEAVMDTVKIRVNNTIINLVKSHKPLKQMEMQFLSKSYRVKWCLGYQNKALVNRILISIDSFYAKYKLNPKVAINDEGSLNPGWTGVGMIGQSIHLLYNQLKNQLDSTIDDGAGNKITRRNAYAEMLLYSRIWNQKNRRAYTNQTMIKDLYGIYYNNKGLQDLGSKDALEEKVALHYFYESVGIQPWLGSDGEDGKPVKNFGDNYWQTTEKGLTKELGFVGNYGEVIDWVSYIYDATRPQPELPGDAKIKEQLEKIALARSYFRYPMLDDDKYAAMRQEVVVGWRDTHYPGDVNYAERGSPLQVAAITLNPKLIGYTQQLFDDNQFNHTIQEQLKDSRLLVTSIFLTLPEQLEIIKAQAPTNYKLPMSWDQPDFVFSDVDDGVIALKNGKEIVYASLYWRARNAINYLSRVHAITPNYDRIATVKIEEQFDSSGLYYTMPDYTNMAFGNGGLKYHDGLHLATVGEKEPIAKIPEGLTYKAGQEHPSAGRANFYKLQYGNYIVAMNASADKEFEVAVPKEFKGAKNLITKEKIGKKTIIKVPARSSLVLYKER